MCHLMYDDACKSLLLYIYYWVLKLETQNPEHSTPNIEHPNLKVWFGEFFWYSLFHENGSFIVLSFAEH